MHASGMHASFAVDGQCGAQPSQAERGRQRASSPAHETRNDE